MILADPTHAADAIDAGYPVFPLLTNGYPATKHGHLDARTGDGARKWIDGGVTRFAIVLDTVTVLDIDNKHADQNGWDSMLLLEARLGHPGDTPFTVLTPNAGLHAFYAAIPELEGRRLVGVEPGLDVLSGGWARMAGCSSQRGRYLLRGEIIPADQLPALPPSWVEYLLQKAERGVQPRAPRGVAGVGKPGARDTDAYFHRGFLDRVCAELGAKIDGQGRRNFLAAKAFKAGTIAPRDYAVEEARRRLLDAALACGLDAKQSAKTIDKQIDAGLARAALERKSAQ